MSDLITRGLHLHIVGEESQALAERLGIRAVPLELADGAIFIVSATHGIVRADSDQWLQARELYIPSLVVITDLSAENESDFEDMTLIAGKILDPVITPYLVLHLDDGSPIALISLETQMIHDNSSGSRVIRASDPEHREVIEQFRVEYLETVQSAGQEAFENALIFPALPWVRESDLGIAEIAEYLNRIPIIR